MRMLFDMSSVMWTCLSVGNDVDSYSVNHNGKDTSINTAEYGFNNSNNLMLKALEEYKLTPKDAILVFEGRDSKKRRCMIEPTYKGGTSRAARAPEAYIEFNNLKERLLTTWRNLGAIGVSQDFVEGDDTLAWLADNMHEDVVIVTNDNDMIVLNKENKFGSKCFVRVNGAVGVNKYGDFSFGLVTLYKCTVGDSGDNIKGAKGFGPAAFLNLIARYDDDGCFELLDLIKDNNRDALAVIAKDNDCKFLDKLVDEWESVYRSYRLCMLHPEWVNTIRSQVEWFAGMTSADCEEQRLKQWRQQKRLVGSSNYAQALEFLQKKLIKGGEVAFDIETSTPVDSDDWLEAQGNPEGVDVFGSYLVGFSLTFGDNNQYTYYVSVKHRDSDNITMAQARQMMQACFDKQVAVVIQNTSFELSVLYEAQDEDGTCWKDAWAIYGERGFVPRILDTMLEGSYVNENEKLGLKHRSQLHLGYTQATFQETTRKSGPVGTLPAGGRAIKSWEDAEISMEMRQYKMDELLASEAFDYGADDTIVTAGLHNFYKLVMQLENTWHVYLEVELDAAYQHAENYVRGVSFSLAKMKELEAIDKVTSDEAWKVVRAYLMTHGWEGTVPPSYTTAITAKEIKEAYAIVMGLDGEDDDEDEAGVDEDASAYHAEAPAVKDAFLGSRVRTPAKLVTLLQSLGHDDFAAMVEGCLAGKSADFTAYVRRFFTGEPKFKASNKMMCKLLYEVMGLPIKVRNKPTAAMKLKGIREGNPKGDALAIEYALLAGTPEQVEVLKALKLMTMVKTRNSLYYSKYPYLLHWKDGKIHSSHNQCATNTRRASSSGPNLQQLPKHQKIEGQPSRFRETFVPHRKDAVIVSMDFAAQELRIIADYSQDENMLACFVGDNLKDMHCMTAAGILAKRDAGKLRSLLDVLTTTPTDATEAQYNAFMLLKDGTPDYQKMYKEFRALGKKVNFTTEYGAAAPKLAATMLIEESVAQQYIDAREAAFPRTAEWKLEVIDEAKQQGYVRTMLGAVRHLQVLLNSDDRSISSKAERQAVNFKIQSSSAEQTKLAEGRMWRQELTKRFDAVCYGPIHDETVFSVAIVDLYQFLKVGHACMVAPFANMRVPIESSISFGPSFGVQIEVGSEPTEDAVHFGLAEMAKLETAAVH